LDIPLFGIFIDDEELNALTGCPTAYNGLYVKERENLVVPRFDAFEPIGLTHKFENATARLWWLDSVFDFHPAKLKNIVLHPQTGGLTMISLTLQVNPRSGVVVDVPALLNAKCTVQIKAAELEEETKDEPELPLEHEGQA
jgi:hypothetical protein